MDYELEKQLVEEALNGRWDAVRHILRAQLELPRLNKLTDTLDGLAVWVDSEARRKDKEVNEQQ